MQPTNPIERFLAWFQEAEKAKIPKVEAVFLATVFENRPSVRTVLYRGLSEGSPRFFTNYESRKSKELERNPHAALLFYWEPLARQIRFEGRVERVSGAESDEYFAGRPRGHQISAWASPQSEIVSGQDFLWKQREEIEKRFEGKEVPRPLFWGGFRLVPNRVEFWTERADRFHLRELYQRVTTGWEASILAP